MKKLLKVLLCVGITLSLSACANQKPKKEDIKEEQEPTPHVVKTKTIQGTVVDATNLSLR